MNLSPFLTDSHTPSEAQCDNNSLALFIFPAIPVEGMRALINGDKKGKFETETDHINLQMQVFSRGTEPSCQITAVCLTLLLLCLYQKG